MVMDNRDRGAVADMDDGELASRLTRLIPTLDHRARAALLYSFFPVASSVGEIPTPRLLAAAVARLSDEGVLRARVETFLAERPRLAEGLWAVHPRAEMQRTRAEIGAWAVALASALLLAGFAGSPRPNDRLLERRPIGLAALAMQTLLVPPADPGAPLVLPRRSPAPRTIGLPVTAGLVASHAAPLQTGQVIEQSSHPVPHPRPTKFRNVDFSGYFKRLPAPTPVPPEPTQTPTPKPRVRALFGRLFGPRR
jgi:hypothetical protein